MHFPESVEQVQWVVRRSRKVRALGCGHSFSRIVDCAGELMSLRRMNGVIALDAGRIHGHRPGGDQLWRALRVLALKRLRAAQPAFHALARYDPSGKFRNDFLDRYVHPA
jgi:hypothetical protein